jgi:D-inositol-3-phosphate glycosyltransferase
MTPGPCLELPVTLLTGGTDRHYVFGLSMALAAKGVPLEVIGSDLVDSTEMHVTPRLTFLNLQGSFTGKFAKKLIRIIRFYCRLIRYAWSAHPQIFHILWNNKLQFLDRTILMAYYKALGKKVVFTAHNVNAGKRDSRDSGLNRFSLKVQYSLSDHIFVHTDKMKSELIEQFGLQFHKISVIPFGVNNAVPDTSLTCHNSRVRLGLADDEKVILFFGALKGYKGLEHLIPAFEDLGSRDARFRLVIAGEPKKGHEEYLETINDAISRNAHHHRIMTKFEFIRDEDTEIYFKAADVAVLPYTSIFQSGILFLAYSFGVPVIAADVGSFREDIVEGRTGFVSPSCKASDLANTINRYFESDLFRNQASTRQQVRDFVKARNSWESVGNTTVEVYRRLLGR